MNSSFLGEVLILVLLVINSCRIFFLKYGKIDALTVLAPVCVILSVLQIIAWNADFFSILIFTVSAAAFFINFRALLRFASGLYVDHYSIAFKTGAALILFVSAVSLGILLYFRPVIVQPSDYKAVQSKVRLVGSFVGGFHTASAFESADGIVTVCAPVPEQPVRARNYRACLLFRTSAPTQISIFRICICFQNVVLPYIPVIFLRAT